MIDRGEFERVGLAAGDALEYADRWRRALESGEEAARLDARGVCLDSLAKVQVLTLFWCGEPDAPWIPRLAKDRWDQIRKEDSPLFDAALEFKRAASPCLGSFFATRLPASNSLHRAVPDWDLLDAFYRALDTLQSASKCKGGRPRPIIASQAAIARAMGRSPNHTGLLKNLKEARILDFEAVPGNTRLWRVWYEDLTQHEVIRSKVDPG